MEAEGQCPALGSHPILFVIHPLHVVEDKDRPLLGDAVAKKSGQRLAGESRYVVRLQVVGRLSGQ